MTMTKESAEEALNTIIANPAGVIEAMGWSKQQFALNFIIFSSMAGLSIEEMTSVNQSIFDQLGYTELSDKKFLTKLLDSIRKSLYLETV